MRTRATPAVQSSMPLDIPANMMADCMTLRTLRDDRKEYSAGGVKRGIGGVRGCGAQGLGGVSASRALTGTRTRPKRVHAGGAAAHVPAKAPPCW